MGENHNPHAPRYPSIDAVDRATPEELATWYRFLRSPGMSAVGHDPHTSVVEFMKVLDAETKVMARICERLEETGGFTPELRRETDWRNQP